MKCSSASTACLADVVARCGAKVHKVEAPWGRIIEPQQIAEALKTTRPKLVAIVHAETSTGALTPVEKISRLAREDRRLGHRRRLQRHPKMSELSAGIVTSLVQPARHGRGGEAEDQSAKLVSRREPAGFLLGAGARLSPHRAHLDELRAARGAAAGAGRRFGESLASAPGKSYFAERRFEKNGAGPRLARRPSALATQCRERSRGRGRSQGPPAPVE